MVTKNKNNLGSLVSAEKLTYSNSGITVFDPMPDITSDFKLNLNIV
jgi:hypothetical protein